MILAGLMIQTSSFCGVDAAWTHLPPTVPPALGCWFWHDQDLKDRNYLKYVDVIAEHSRFTILTTSLRLSEGELTDDFVHDAIREGSEYASKFGIKVAMDLDIRLARAAFFKNYPNEAQEMLRLIEAPRVLDGDTFIESEPASLSDHYTGNTKPYYSMGSRLVRVYAFARAEQGIDPKTAVDITAACRVEESSADKIKVVVPKETTDQPLVCAFVAFSHFAPDVYGDHLLSFQRELLKRYADASLSGACKDEWGFPPCFDGTPKHDDYWYSESMAAAYQKRTGRDLVRDCLLMYAGEVGRENERRAAVNHFMEMNRLRNIEIEDDFYKAVKETFGNDAMVSTHPTWYPYCDRREFKKNGLDWWAARRDYAQTDEVAPFPVRTAIAKKWNNKTWHNMFYAPTKQEYEFNIWSHAMAGGRINYHPLYPLQSTPCWNMYDLFKGNLMRGESRIRMLNFINPAPLDCRVAVVFGHPCAMNWAGPAYEDVGLDLTNKLWLSGYYADLIPSSEIESGSLKYIDGKIAYGTQRYDYVVLYHPEFERPSIAEFFKNAAEGDAKLARVGDWTLDFDGKPFDGAKALPTNMAVYQDSDACLAKILEELPKIVPVETPAIEAVCWNTKLVQPPAAGHCRLVDGTRLILAGEKDPAGDPIQTDLDVDGRKVSFDAVGVAAIRLAKDGSVNAMVAGGLKRFQCGDFIVELPERADVAIWRGDNGQFHGAFQGDGKIPQNLTSLTSDWFLLAPLKPLEE
jgi:hypothetical protein